MVLVRVGVAVPRFVCIALSLLSLESLGSNISPSPTTNSLGSGERITYNTL